MSVFLAMLFFEKSNVIREVKRFSNNFIFCIAVAYNLHKNADYRLRLALLRAHVDPGLPTCLPQKKRDSSHKAYTYKTCITKHTIDSKTRQKH